MSPPLIVCFFSADNNSVTRLYLLLKATRCRNSPLFELSSPPIQGRIICAAQLPKPQILQLSPFQNLSVFPPAFELPLSKLRI